MKSWAEVIEFRKAAEIGEPISWDEACERAGFNQTQFRKIRSIEHIIFDQEYNAARTGVGRPLKASEN